MYPVSGRKMTPFGEYGGAIEFDILAAVEVVLVVPAAMTLGSGHTS